MNQQLDQSTYLTPLHCSYSSEYQDIYEPGYDMGFVFIDEDEFEDEDEFAKDSWIDFPPMPDSSGIGRA